MENCLVQVGELLRMENSMHMDRHYCRAEKERPGRSANLIGKNAVWLHGWWGRMGDIVHRQAPYLGTCYKVTWEMLEEVVHSQCLIGVTDFEKLLKEDALCRSQATEKDIPCRSPVQEPLLPAGLWETRRKNPFLLRVLPVSSTGITSSQMSQVKYFHSPPPSS